ncbi:MAG: zinc ribbon domain-containing protein [Chloroflexi bacterium]|nr:zinc ribbon domain-containing protein [Chloroflexota bacterium]
MRCSQCGSNNPENARFCGNCGLPATPPDEPPVVQPEEHGQHRREAQTASPVICPNCGITGIPRDNACASCGNEIATRYGAPVSIQPADLAGPFPTSDFERRGLGDFMSETIRLYRLHPRVFLSIAVVPQLPGLAGMALPSLAAEVVFTIVGLALAAIAQGAVVYAVAAMYSGAAPSVAVSFRRAFHLGLTLVICQVLLLVLLFSSALLIIILIGIPMVLYFLVLLAFYPQAIIVEKMGVAASFRRSAALVKGDWWRLFGIGFCYVIVFAVPLVLALMISGGANPMLGVMVSALIATVAMPWMFIGATLVYFDLRLRKEDFTLETLAREISDQSR